jgi:hypothetical protein
MIRKWEEGSGFEKGSMTFRIKQKLVLMAVQKKDFLCDGNE